jgi:hypothetical protein
MPTYLFHDTEENEYFEMKMKISEREQYLAENKHIQPILTAPAIVSGTGSSKKVPDGFKDVLTKISDAHPSSPLANKHKRKTIKEARTARVVESHVKKISNRIKNS